MLLILFPLGRLKAEEAGIEGATHNFSLYHPQKQKYSLSTLEKSKTEIKQRICSRETLTHKGDV